MTTPTPVQTKRPKRIFVVIIFVLLALFAWAFVRGTWAAESPTDPTTPEQGVVSQLVMNHGEKDIRTAVVIPVSVETAWKILANYEEWERLFKTIRRKQVAEKLDENRHHVVSEVLTPLGTIHLDFIVTHERTAEGGYRAWWDAPTKELPVNLGTIEISPRGKEQTLLVYTIRKQYRVYPQFLVNNMLLRQQPDVVRTLRTRMLEMAKEP